MSPIHTCELNDMSPFDYLTELQRHTEDLSANVLTGCPGITAWHWSNAGNRTAGGPHSRECAEVIDVRADAICKLCEERTNGKSCGVLLNIAGQPKSKVPVS